MTAEQTMNPILRRTSPRALARIGGLLYLLIILGGLFAPFAIAPSGMMLGNAALPTVTKILSSQSLYVLGGAIQLFVYACDIGVALVFYELLKPVNRRIALLATFFRLVFVAIACANIVNHFAPLVFLCGPDSLTSFTTDQLQALAIAFIRLRTFGFDIALLFFGFHCILVGYLIFRSTFLPRVLGAALAIGGAGYVANIFATAIPLTSRVHLFPYVMLPAGLAEILLTLWLLIVGVNLPRWKDQAETAVLPC
ncbi:DUF4386 domain-containing protein [Tunturibacter empetritectus]|uniref:DUF4386 domain-containing protein n=1 Tax=Tunturiibacter lichenicola TaxID=2051959 RepID=A0A7W8JB17_9BACT|nr:DUF4386 domain-containing protein [Edaphobacter lichenicola]MBB5345990.1 hypothetical protein [Edaphobacter lichenicola]